jgi:hypothetical protein
MDSADRRRSPSSHFDGDRCPGFSCKARYFTPQPSSCARQRLRIGWLRHPARLDVRPARSVSWPGDLVTGPLKFCLSLAPLPKSCSAKSFTVACIDRGQQFGVHPNKSSPSSFSSILLPPLLPQSYSETLSKSFPILFGGLFFYISPEKRAPANHPLRKIRELVREVLKDLTHSLGKLCASPSSYISLRRHLPRSRRCASRGKVASSLSRAAAATCNPAVAALRRLDKPARSGGNDIQ